MNTFKAQFLMYMLFFAAYSSPAIAKTYLCEPVQTKDQFILTLQFDANEKNGKVEMRYLDPQISLIKANFRARQTLKNALIESERIGKFNYQVKMLIPQDYRARNTFPSTLKFTRTSTNPYYSDLDCRRKRD